jgi:hypothetical protein
MKSARLLLSMVLIVQASRATVALGAGASGPRDPSSGIAAPEFEPPKSHLAAYAWGLGAIGLPAAYYAWAAVNQHYGYERAVPLTVLGFGLVVGPSAGQVYAGEFDNAVKGVLLRSAAVPAGLLMGGLLALATRLTEDEDDKYSMADPVEMAFIGGLVFGAGAVYLLGLHYSVVDTHRAVDGANERARRRWLERVSLAPTLVPFGDGRTATRWAPGLAFTASF